MSDRRAEGLALLVGEHEDYIAELLSSGYADLAAGYALRLEQLRNGSRPSYAEQQRALMRLQTDRCAICDRRERSRPFVLDHDHETALSRGMLCRSCNAEEGHSDHADFERYRADHPARGFGWIYQDYFGRWAEPRPVEDAEPELERLDRHATFRLAEFLGASA